MDKETKKFIKEIDIWIKQIRKEFAEFSDVPVVVNDNTDDIRHNYELIYEFKDQITELKQEVNALKLIQIISLRTEKRRELEKKHD